MKKIKKFSCIIVVASLLLGVGYNVSTSQKLSVQENEEIRVCGLNDTIQITIYNCISGINI